jgi:signal transduction histidine kinase
MATEFAFDSAVLNVLERAGFAAALRLCAQGQYDELFENLACCGARLAKLQVDTRAVAGALDLWRQAGEACLARLAPGRRGPVRAALDRLSSTLFIALSGAYFDAQKRESAMLTAALASERAHIADSLRERELRIAELSGHLLRVQEQERRHISRELHDETGQALMVLRLCLGMMESSAPSPAAQQKLREMLEVVDRAVVELRRIMGRLSPLVLEELGLVAAIRKEAKDLAASAGIRARVAIDDDFGRLPGDVESAMYRVVQEALHNVAKHAQASSVEIRLARGARRVTLVVADNGVGISRPATVGACRTFGLQGIRERISMLGGTVRIRSAKGKGTRLEVRVPAARGGLETLLARPERTGSGGSESRPN